ncbi:MAG TPA: HEAT repeat domain-containing protein [Candidatus Eisenbacteria bacterium]
MPKARKEAAELLQRADPGAKAREAQRLEDFGAELSRALEDRVFDPDPETRSLAVSLIQGRPDPIPPDLLASALEDPSPDVVVSAAEALASLRIPRASDALSECLASRPELSGPLALALAKLEDPGVEELLMDRLGEEEPAVRVAVIRALGANGTARSTPELVRFLQCGVPAVEAEALAALAHLHERAPQAVPAGSLPAGLLERRLRGLVASGDRGAQRTGIALIAWLRPPEGPALLLMLLDSPDRVVRERAREAFGMVAAGAEGDTLRSIAEAADRIPGVAALALDRVAAAREEEALNVCLGLTRHSDALVRERAAALAGRSGGRGAANALLLLSGDAIGHVRAQAAEGLGLMRWASAGPILESMLLSDPYPDVRQAALTALRAIREHEVDAERLFERAQDGPARAAALRVCDPRRAGDLFQGAVSDPDAGVRLAAAMSLNERGVWLETAVVLLADEDPRVRAHALRARLEASSALGLEPLRAFLRDPDAGLRQTFAAALEQASGVERAAWLCQLLGDPCAAVGRAAARALGRRHDSHAVGALLDAVSTGAPPVAAQAIESLGSLGDPEALPRLRAVARGGDPELRDLATDAVRRIEAAQT